MANKDGDGMLEVKDNKILSREELAALLADSQQRCDDLQTSIDELTSQTSDIRHRIKNIFQVITSLLNLQERSSNTANCSIVFSKYRSRIQMMSVMYEFVYGSSCPRTVALGDYLQTIIRAAISDYRSEFGRINLFFDMGDTAIQVDQAIPFGLIAAELAINSATHAFPSSFQKTPSLSFSAKKVNNSIIFSVADNGIGMQEIETDGKAGTLGYFLINVLCRQIKGNLAKDLNEGTKITITFPE